MIQDIYPHTFHNEYVPSLPKPDDIVFSYEEKDIHIRKDGSFFRISHLSENCITDLIYLFTIDDQAFFLGNLSKEDHVSLPIRKLREKGPRYLRFAAVTGWQLYTWYENNRFCGKCGSHMKADEKERAMRCPECGHIVYPTIMPAVIVGVIYEDKLLLTKYAGRSYGHYALVAGYTEIGETIEETVCREVREETGIEVTDITYYKCQPWSFSSTLLFGFYARAKSPEIKLDTNELSEAVWVSRNEDIDAGDDISLTSEMIRHFMKGKHGYEF